MIEIAPRECRFGGSKNTLQATPEQKFLFGVLLAQLTVFPWRIRHRTFRACPNSRRHVRRRKWVLLRRGSLWLKRWRYTFRSSRCVRTRIRGIAITQ